MPLCQNPESQSYRFYGCEATDKGQQPTLEQASLQISLCHCTVAMCLIVLVRGFKSCGLAKRAQSDHFQVGEEGARTTSLPNLSDTCSSNLRATRSRNTP
eukprot:scaffold8925_cov31-Prasinocladus_malaysianus.AAC.1